MTSNNGPNSWRRALYSPPNGSKSGQKQSKIWFFWNFKYLIMNKLENKNHQNRVPLSPQTNWSSALCAGLFSCKAVGSPAPVRPCTGKAPKAARPLSFNLFSTAPPRRRWGMWRTQCGKSRQYPIFWIPVASGLVRLWVDLCGWNHLLVLSQMTVTFQYPVLKLPIRSR